MLFFPVALGIKNVDQEEEKVLKGCLPINCTHPPIFHLISHAYLQLLNSKHILAKKVCFICELHLSVAPWRGGEGREGEKSNLVTLSDANNQIHTSRVPLATLFRLSILQESSQTDSLHLRLRLHKVQQHPRRLGPCPLGPT